MQPHCFVCFDDAPPLHRMCACDMLVHEHCLRKSTRDVAAHAAGCPVCRAPYPGTSTRRRSFRVVVADFFPFAFLVAFTTSTAIVGLISALPFQDANATLGVQVFFATCATSSFLVVVVYVASMTWRFGRSYRFIRLERQEMQHVELHFPPPANTRNAPHAVP